MCNQIFGAPVVQIVELPRLFTVGRRDEIPVLDTSSATLYKTNGLFNLMVNRMTPDNLSATFAALADPTRRAILARLARRSATVSELAEPFAMTLPAISKHLKVLERAGLVSRGRDAQRRPCRLEAIPLHAIADWVEGYRRFWEERFERLAAVLETMETDQDEPAIKETSHGDET